MRVLIAGSDAVRTPTCRSASSGSAAPAIRTFKTTAPKLAPIGSGVASFHPFSTLKGDLDVAGEPSPTGGQATDRRSGMADRRPNGSIPWTDASHPARISGGEKL